MTGRNRKLLAACGALTAVLGCIANLAIDPGPTLGDMSPVNAPTAPPAMARTLAPIATFNAIADRPLFRPSRRPEQPVIAEAKPVPPPAPAPPLAPPASGLLAVIIGPERKAAVLRLNTGATLNLAEGESIAGWTLARVLPERVVLHSATSDIEMAFADHPAGNAGGISVAQSILTPPARKRR